MFSPFVAQCRKDSVVWEEESTITESIRDVNWCDDDLAQIDDSIESDSLKVNNQYLIVGNNRIQQDKVSSVPETTYNAVTMSNIIHRFKQNGIIDTKKGIKYPYFEIMLATCRKSISAEQYQLRILIL